MQTLATDKLTIGYSIKGGPPKRLAENISLSLRPGELVCLLGPNGVGKSTLIRTLAGLHDPLQGHVMIDDQAITNLSPKIRARTISLVLTERINTGMLTAKELVSLGRHPHTKWTGALTDDDSEIIENALKSVHALDLADRHIHELSDGEQQKIMIARALAQDAPILLLDEPTAFLDLQHRLEIIHILRELAHKKNLAVMLSTHDLDLAMRSADYIWISTHNGEIKTGAPEDLVVNNTFQKTFSNHNVGFDPISGQFKFCQKLDPIAWVSGDEIAQKWTGKALERMGYCSSADQANATLIINIKKSDTGYIWELGFDNKTESFNNIYSLIKYIGKHPPS